MDISSRRYNFACVFGVGLILFFIAFVVGFRPVEVGADTEVYSQIYQELLEGQEPSHNFEFLYGALVTMFSMAGIEQGFFLALLSLVSLFFVFFSFFKFNLFFQKDKLDASIFIYGFLFLLSSPVFFSMQVNVVRQGVSCLALIFFYSCLLSRDYNIFFLLSAFFSVGFHSTAFLFIAVGVGLFFKYNHVLFFALSLALAYSFGVLECFVFYFSDKFYFDIYDRVINYGFMEGYRSGIRLDFVFFSCGLGLLIDVLSRFFMPARNFDSFINCVKVYWLFLIPFFFLGFGAFSDRLLINAWLFYSVLVGLFFSHVNLFSFIPRFVAFSIFAVACFVFYLRVQCPYFFI